MTDEANIWTKRQNLYDRWFPALVAGFIVVFGLLIALIFTAPTKPAQAPLSVQTATGQGLSPEPETERPLNLRLATVEDLDKLDGIGPKKAAQIVALREEGKISSVDDLQKVKGIGEKLFESIKDQLVWE